VALKKIFGPDFKAVRARWKKLDTEEFMTVLFTNYNTGDHVKDVEVTERVGHVREKINAFCDLMVEPETKRSPARCRRWQQNNVNCMRNK